MIGKEQLIRSESDTSLKKVFFCLINIAKGLTSFYVKDFLVVNKDEMPLRRASPRIYTAASYLDIRCLSHRYYSTLLTRNSDYA